jgi:hypothetical protein
MIAGNLRWMKSALLGRSRHRPKVLISSIRMSKNFFRANLIDSSNSESPSGGNRMAMRHEPARPDQLAHSAGACRCRQRARVGGCARRAEYLIGYLDGAGLRGDPKGPLFRAIGRGTGKLTRTVRRKRTPMR